MPSEESEEDCAISSSMATPEIFRSVPRSNFPIRVSDHGPRPFDIECQERVMRWKHLFPFTWFPTWETEPDMELIKEVARDHLHTCGFDSDVITVEYFAAGTYNKLYTINTTHTSTRLPAQCLFRVALPIYPWYKVESEVATTEFVRHFTDIPVPVIYAYDSSTNNKLGLEWMLVEKIPGSSLAETWPDMSFKTLTKLTTSIAEWLDQLSSFAFDKIGSLYMRYTETDFDFYIGPMVEQNLYDGRRLTYRIDRGPFPSLQTYYDAILDAQQHEIKDPRYLAEYQRLARATEDENADDEAGNSLKAKSGNGRDSAYESDDERKTGAEDTSSTDSRKYTGICNTSESAEDKPVELLEPGDVSDIFVGRVLMYGKNMLATLPEALEALRNSLPVLVQEPGGDRFSTLLMHPDISTDNILVDIGEIKALVDWEMASLHPPILKTQIPQFLQSFDNIEPPTVEQLELWGEASFHRECKTFILTKLRKVFRERLEELQSRYLLIFEEGSGLHKALYERIFDRWQHRGDIVEWVDVQLAPTDDESDYDSDEDGGQPSPDVKDGEMDVIRLDVEGEGDDNKLAEEMARIATETLEVWNLPALYPDQSWLRLLVSWSIFPFKLWNGWT